MQNLLQNYPYAINVRVRVRFGFWQNAHVRATCVRPKIECANVRACEAKNRRNSQIASLFPRISELKSKIDTRLVDEVILLKISILMMNIVKTSR